MKTKLGRRTLLRAAGATAATAASIATGALRTQRAQGSQLQPSKVDQGAEKVALALSGGGARGDFQLGALRYLYDHQGIRPDIICSTSVGSVNGAKLAEGDGAIDELEQIWRGFQNKREVFGVEPWLRDEREEIRALVDVTPKWDVEVGPGGSPVVGEISLGATLGELRPVGNLITNLVVGGLIAEFREGGKYGNEVSLFNLNPISNLLVARLNPQRILEWSNGGERKLRMATVAMKAAKLRYVTEDGTLLERDNQTPVGFVNVDVNAPKCSSFEVRVKALEQGILGLQKQLQSSAGAQKLVILGLINKLNTDLRTAKSGLAACKAQYPPVIERRPVKTTVIEGVLASAAIPAIFRPVEMMGDLYVDGGVMEITPVQAALDLGATKVFAIQCSPSEAESWSDAPPRLLSILERTLGLLLSEIDQTDIDRLDSRVVVIRPSLRVEGRQIHLHDTTTVNPGLIDIAFDYGYMRAADVITNNTPEESNRVDLITLYRREAWRTEWKSAALGRLDEVRLLKQRIRDAAMQRIERNGVMPPYFERWWTSYERHPSGITDYLNTRPF